MFHRWTRSKDGRADWCKSCKSAYQHSNRAAEQSRYKAWRAANLDRHTAGVKKWQAANPEKVRQIARDAQRRAYWKNPEKFINKSNARRVLYMKSAAMFDPETWFERVEEFNNHCAYCLRPVLNPEQEHMQPISRGGEHVIENLIPACRQCNASKGNRTLLEFLAYHSAVALPRAA